MIKKSTYIILLIILLVFFLVILFAFGLDNIKTKNNPTIILGEDTIWTYQDKKWSNVNIKQKSNEINWKKYEIYLDNEKYGSYYLWHDDKWYIFDSKKNAINYEGNLLAYIANYKVNVSSFEEEEIDDNDSYVNFVLEENNISESEDFTTYYKTTFDFDNDNSDEVFYVISNVFSENKGKTNVSIIFMVKNDMIYYVYKNINKKNTYDTCKPFINSFIDLENDKKYELIISCGRYSAGKQLDMLYEFKKDKFNLLVTNS